MQTMRAIYQSKGQLATAESSYRLNLQPQTHAFYIHSYYADLDLSCSETNAAVTLSTQYSNFHLGQTLALGIVLMQ